MQFATVEDLRLRWPNFPFDMEDEAQVASLDASLLDAAVWLGVNFAEIPAEPEEPLASLLKQISCRMVKRSINTSEFDGFSQFSETSGPFSDSFKLSGSGDNFYVTAQERESIEAALNAGTRARSMEMRG